MITFSESLQILISREPMDMRKAINGMVVLITEHLKQHPQQPYLYLFYNKQRTKLKGLFWDRNGFVLIYKRLERQKFKLPKAFSQDHLLISHQQLAWLLAGFEFTELGQFPELNYQHFY